MKQGGRFQLVSGSMGLAAITALAVMLLPPAARAIEPEVTTTSASLNGVYMMQMSKPKMQEWSAQKVCTYGNQKVTYFGGGHVTYNQVLHGTATFDGKGHWKATAIEEPQFDQPKSNATVVITCPATQNGSPTINNGHAVFDTAPTQQVAGTYVVTANGTGTMTLSVVSAAPIYLSLAQINASGVAMSVLLRESDTQTNFQTGIAIHQ